MLADPAKRAAYDHDLGLSQSHGPAAAGQTPHGSHSSAAAASPFGARPASGLSRRRGAFRGPPPSFFRAGGYGQGATAAQRRAAEEAARARARAAGTRDFESDGAGQGEGAGAGPTGGRPGFAPGQGAAWEGREVPHFDREGHFRTQRAQEERVSERRRRILEERELERREREGEIGGGGLGLGFVVGVLVLSFVGPGLLAGGALG